MEESDQQIIRFSNLGKTWIFDLDGTIVMHNGHKDHGEDTLLPGAQQFFQEIAPTDFIILVTARSIRWKEITELFLEEHNIRFDKIIYDVPHGERILVNDKKNSGLKTAYALNTTRNEFLKTKFIIDENL